MSRPILLTSKDHPYRYLQEYYEFLDRITAALKSWREPSQAAVRPSRRRSSRAAVSVRKA
jgi:hypothetical protein